MFTVRCYHKLSIACLLPMLLMWQACRQPTPERAAEHTHAHVEDASCHTTPNRDALAGTTAASSETRPASPARASADGSPNGMVLIPGGTFRMGADAGMPYEAPAHEVTLASFYIDRTEVTVREFRRFVEATGYVTEAERFGWSGVFDREQGTWTRGDGATWRAPDGAGSTARDDEPVTQVSWTDANEYARWAGKRLPTEAEFEYAARGGLVGKEYAWGDELRPGGRPVANWWQGEFPVSDTGEDGYRGRAPVGSFAANGYGLHDVAGNVWEWCSDWYADDYYAHSPRTNPKGAASGTERVMRGGSWLCAENYCTNYRAAGRSHSTPDTGLNNVGFRCAKDGEDVISARPPAAK